MRTVLKTIDQDFFSTMERFLHESLDEFRFQNVPDEDLQIYIPDYLLRMWESQVFQAFTLPTKVDFRKFEGVKIFDNYQQTVVVSFKNISLHKRMKPAILLIP